MCSLSILRSLGAFALFATLPACSEPRAAADDAGTPCTPQDLSTTPADLSPATPKCAAADGLKGDNLLCVDFKDVQNLTSLTGWNFNCTSGSWGIQGGVLQVNNFSMFADTCTFKLPALSAADYQKYSRFSLALVQRVDLNPTQQRAQIMLGADDQDTRLLIHMTGKQPRLQHVYQVAKTDLPIQAMGGFQPLFKISSNAQVGTLYSGWQIESIAIQGIP